MINLLIICGILCIILIVEIVIFILKSYLKLIATNYDKQLLRLHKKEKLCIKTSGYHMEREGTNVKKGIK